MLKNYYMISEGDYPSVMVVANIPTNRNAQKDINKINLKVIINLQIIVVCVQDNYVGSGMPPDPSRDNSFSLLI